MSITLSKQFTILCEGCFDENVGKWNCSPKYHVRVLFNIILLKSNVKLLIKCQKLINFFPTN